MAGPPPTVSKLLGPDPSAGAAGVTDDVVRALLGRIGLLPGRSADEEPDAPAVRVGADGRWRVGPLHGRTTKETAQFVGAGAREAERRRRLAELDARIAEARRRAEGAEEERRVAQERLDALSAWLGAQPGHDTLVRAWTTVDERESACARADSELGEIVAAARVLRAEAAQYQRRLEELGATHDLPLTEQGLAAHTERLSAARADIEQRRRDTRSAVQELQRWQQAAEEAGSDGAELAGLAAAADRARADFSVQRDEHAMLLEAEGEGVRELEARLADLRRREVEQSDLVGRLDARHEELTGRVGALGEAARAARAAVEAARPELETALERLAALDDAPGVPECVMEELDAGDAAEAPRGAEGTPWRLGGRSVREIRAVMARVGSGGDLERARNLVLQATTALQSGPAAGYEPRHFEEGGVLVAMGRDDGRDLAIVRLHARLTAEVERDRELLTVRERKLFEDHVLGQLGEALRAVRRKSEDLVAAMNDQLRDVSTSQGIRVRLRWRLRDELPAEARRAVELLRQPLGSLLADQKDELRDSLHRLIDVSRAEAPEESYAVHLARALDYRQWNAFTVQYHRPETGDWRDLQRRTALSQGEQKVLCYLPLFAAAAAHFTSVAGAAPHAPRFVLLDDAFLKIDVLTHPLLFGLLVQLDLDFVVTSERLWGTHATVPSLAIYEALRSPGERGIAQYEHRWDGHQLAAVGA